MLIIPSIFLIPFGIWLIFAAKGMKRMSITINLINVIIWTHLMMCLNSGLGLCKLDNIANEGQYNRIMCVIQEELQNGNSENLLTAVNCYLKTYYDESGSFHDASVAFTNELAKVRDRPPSCGCPEDLPDSKTAETLTQNGRD